MNMTVTVIMQLTEEYVHISIIDPITIITNEYGITCYYAVNWRVCARNNLPSIRKAFTDGLDLFLKRC